MLKTIRIKPATKCAVHAWETLGLHRRLLAAITSKGGIDACGDCVKRARDEAERVLALAEKLKL